MNKLIMSMLLSLSLFLSSCANINLSNFDMNNQAQQLIVKTSIQLATATYLDKNSNEESVNLVIAITDDVMNYLTSDDVYNNNIIGIQKKLHIYIGEQDLTVAEKIALTSLSDVIISQAVLWAKINLEDTLTESHSNVLFFCANAMNATAKLYTFPESKNRSYGVTNKYET